MEDNQGTNKHRNLLKQYLGWIIVSIIRHSLCWLAHVNCCNQTLLHRELFIWMTLMQKKKPVWPRQLNWVKHKQLIAILKTFSQQLTTRPKACRKKMPYIYSNQNSPCKYKHMVKDQRLQIWELIQWYKKPFDRTISRQVRSR